MHFLKWLWGKSDTEWAGACSARGTCTRWRWPVATPTSSSEISPPFCEICKTYLRICLWIFDSETSSWWHSNPRNMDYVLFVVALSEKWHRMGRNVSLDAIKEEQKLDVHFNFVPRIVEGFTRQLKPGLDWPFSISQTSPWRPLDSPHFCSLLSLWITWTK